MEQGDESRYAPSLSDALIDYDRVADVYALYVTSDLDIAFYVTEAGKAQGGKVLELMCGTGRVSIPLLEAGVNLSCVDASEGMLARLEERLRALQLEAQVLRADVRYLDLREEFDLALIPFHSFSELVAPYDQELALRAIHGCLKEGGRLICPLQNPASRGRSADGALRLNGSFPTADGLLLISGFETLDESSGVVSRIQLYEFFDASNDLSAKRVLPMRFALIDRAGFAKLADSAGFTPVALYGNYDRGEYREGSSPYMIWVLEKSWRL